MKFHTLTIKNLRRETESCVSIAFEIPESLAADYRFVQGQYLTLRSNLPDDDGNSAEIRRSYSICSSPLDGELRIAVKQVEGGKFSTFANQELRTGDTLDVMTPTGKFGTKIDPQQSKNYVAFAAGSGITPILSILKTVLRAEPKSHFTLVYGNKNTASVIFKEEIEGLKNQYLDRLSVYHVLSRERQDTELFNGRIDGKKCHIFCEKLINISNSDEFFLCGPAEMIAEVSASLQSHGIEKNKIHAELFAAPNAFKHAKTLSDSSQSIDNQNISKISVRLDGIYYDFDLATDGDNVLDAAMRAGADLPFACKGGVCCTCRAKVTEGSVTMDVNYALEAEELSQGFVLTCQSHPSSPRVVIDFDEK